MTMNIAQHRNHRRRASDILVAAIAALLLWPGAQAQAADDPDYEDWWLCANECGPDDADCVDKCTDDYNSSHQVNTSARVLKLRLPTARPALRRAKLELVSRCPDGTHLSPFDMPIYDAKGLFVVGHETVWMCIPDDLEPAG